jgi:4-diphosphocytidyl-2-C-methyl-D-erythritol kinase
LILKTSVPAKINLWLEVIRKRGDGYHDISSLMLPISVFDRISLEVSRGRGRISLRCDAVEIPDDASNLAWRAAELFLGALGEQAGIHITLEKKIPSGAGLGGGSSDAAGVLVALNSCFDHALPISLLEDIACRIGADVPFFLHGIAALATGIGERLEFVPDVPEYPLLLIKPPIIVPTAWVYQNLKLTRGKAQITLYDFNSRPWRFDGVVENDLESVTVSKYPIIADLKAWLLGNGALAASMSGSGPTVFGIFSSREAADAAGSDAAVAWKGCWIKTAVTEDGRRKADNGRRITDNGRRITEDG